MSNGTENEPRLYPELITDKCGDNGYVLCMVALWILRTVPIIFLILGTIGNCLNILVITRKRMRTYSTSVYILFLAVSDLVFLWASILETSEYVFMGINIQNWSIFNCRFHFWSVFMTGGFSIWLLVLLTVERTLYTTIPVFARSNVTPKTALATVVITFICLALLTGPTLFMFKFTGTEKAVDSGIVRNSTISQPIQTAVVKRCVLSSEAFNNFKNNEWRILVLVIFNIIPMIIVVAGNAIIAMTIRNRTKKIHPTPNLTCHTTSLSAATETTVKKKRPSPARMLLTLSVCFMITTTPYCVFVIILTYLNVDMSSAQFAYVQLANAIVVILVLCNFTFNFYLYFISGSIFKQEWMCMVKEIKRKYMCLFKTSERIEPPQRSIRPTGTTVL